MNDLANNKTDCIVTSLKLAAEAVPYIGSALAEIIGTTIPNQRIDRIVKYAEALSAKIKSIDVKMEALETKIHSHQKEYFVDLLEESLKQAAKSITDKRRQYISSIIVNGISSDKVEFIESKQLLKILGELNDIEIIWLRNYMVEGIGMDKAFYTKHEDVLNPSGAPEFDKNILQQNYKDHLVQLNLLERKHKVDGKTKQLEVDRNGLLQISGYKITQLGRLLLKHIGLTKDGFTPLETDEESA